MDDSIRYLYGETLGKVVSGFAGRALDFLAVFRRQEVKGDQRIRTLVRWGLRALAAGAALGACPRGAARERGYGFPRIRAWAGQHSSLCLLGFPAAGQRRRTFGPTYSGQGCTTGSRHEFVLLRFLVDKAEGWVRSC